MKKCLAAFLCGTLLTGLLSVSALAVSLADGTTTFTLSNPADGTASFTQTAYVVDANGRYVTDENGKFLTEQVTKTAWVVPEGTVVAADCPLLVELYVHMADGDYWDVRTDTDLLTGAPSLIVNCAARLAEVQADGLNADQVIYRVRGTQSIGAGVRGVGTGVYLTCAGESEPEPEVPTPPVFDDVREGDWFYSGVTAAVQAGLISGNDMGQFDPNGTFTWAQAVTLAVRADQYLSDQSVFGPADQTGEHWYDIYVAYALQRGIFFAEAPADWDAPITRGESVVIFAALLGEIDPAFELPAELFPDLEPGAVRDAARTLVYAGACNGTGGGKFSPDRIFTRSEAATLVARMTGLIEGVSVGS